MSLLVSIGATATQHDLFTTEKAARLGLEVIMWLCGYVIMGLGFMVLEI